MHVIWKSWSRELKQSLVDIFCLDRDGWCLACRALLVFPPFPFFCLASPESCYVFGQLPSYLLLHSNCHRIRLIAQPCLSLPCTLTSREKTLQHPSPMSAMPTFSLHRIIFIHLTQCFYSFPACMSLFAVFTVPGLLHSSKNYHLYLFSYHDHILLPHFQSISFLLLSLLYCMLCILFSLICHNWPLFTQTLPTTCWWHLTVASGMSAKEVYLYSSTPIYVRYISKPKT